MASKASVFAAYEPPASDRQSWFIPNDAVTDWSIQPIASGGFGQVFTASYYGAPVAAKRLHAHFYVEALVNFEKEIGVWHRLSHPHILPLLGACDKDAHGNSIRPYMISPYLPNGNLLKYVSNPNNSRSAQEKLRLLFQVAAGMSYLHGNNIVHGDLKAENVLLDGLNNAVITDFGLSRTKHTSASAARAKPTGISGGTHGYMAPEMLDGDEPAGSSKKTDVFAFAITVYEVLNNGKVWVTKDNTPLQPLQIISQLLQSKRPKRFDGIPDGIWALVERCWAQDPAARPVFAEILAVLQPYNRAGVSAIPAPTTVRIPSISQVTSNFTTLSVDCYSPTQPSHHAELKFDGIDDVVHIPASIVFEAKQGDPDACLEAAKLVSQGLPAHHDDWKLAAHLYKAASDRGNLEASFQLAWLALLGEGVSQNDRSALWHWQEVSTKSSDKVIRPIATHMLGWIHYLGRGIQQDEQKGIKIIRENQSDEFKLGEDESLAAYWNSISSDSPTARKFFELCQLGSNRDWLCKHLMGVCLRNGFGVRQDQEKAANIFEQLANEGNSDSQLWIGECYYRSKGVPRDHKKAFEWFSKSAKQGNSYGQWMVGVCYYYGDGVTKDFAKAFEWYYKSAKQENRYGQYWLGGSYKYGWGVPVDMNSAIFWYRKSADQGFGWAIDKLQSLDKEP